MKQNTTPSITQKPAVIVRRIECASRLGVSIATLDRMVRDGRIIKPTKIGARASGWPESYLDSLINQTISPN